MIPASLVLIFYIVFGILGVWFLIVGIVAFHRFLSYHPAQPRDIPDKAWRISRFRAAGLAVPDTVTGSNLPEHYYPRKKDKPMKRFEDRFMSDEEIAERDVRG